MEAFTDLFAFVAGVPAVAGLILTGAAIILSSDWRLSLTALLIQYVLAGLALTRFIQAEVAVVKILTGVLVVFILYLTARRTQEIGAPRQDETRSSRFLGLQVGWAAGPLGLPLRLLATLLVALALVRLFNDADLSLAALPALSETSPEIVFVCFWLGAMGMVGLVLSDDPLRVAPALLTILVGFDLIYANLKPGLAVVGFFGALLLLAAVSFSYLAIARELDAAVPQPAEEDAET
jgi:hypothetical protein